MTSHYNGNIIYLHSTERLGNSSKTVLRRRQKCRRRRILKEVVAQQNQFTGVGNFADARKLHYFTDKAGENAGTERREQGYYYGLNEIFGFCVRKVHACDVKHRFA